LKALSIFDHWNWPVVINYYRPSSARKPLGTRGETSHRIS